MDCLNLCIGIISCIASLFGAIYAIIVNKNVSKIEAYVKGETLYLTGDKVKVEDETMSL